jgi:hypothetical protein
MSLKSLDSGLEQKHEDVSRPRHFDNSLNTSTAALAARQQPRHFDSGLAPRRRR